MAKNIEKLYNDIFKLRASMEDIVERSQGVVTSARDFPGMISNVVTEQFNKYFIPAMRSYIDDIKTPGSIPGVVKFLDAVPLALTREKEPISPVDPVVPEKVNVTAPAGSTVTNPVEELPQNASYAKPATVQESQMKEATDSPAVYRLNEIIDMLGADQVLFALIKWLPNERVAEFVEDISKDFDLQESQLKEAKSDGWPEGVAEVFEDVFNDSERFTYEVKMCRRGSFTSVDTLEGLAEAARKIGEEWVEVADNLQYVDDPDIDDEEFEEKKAKNSDKLTEAKYAIQYFNVDKENSYIGDPEEGSYMTEDSWTSNINKALTFDSKEEAEDCITEAGEFDDHPTYSMRVVPVGEDASDDYKDLKDFCTGCLKDWSESGQGPSNKRIVVFTQKVLAACDLKDKETLKKLAYDYTDQRSINPVYNELMDFLKGNFKESCGKKMKKIQESSISAPEAAATLEKLLRAEAEANDEIKDFNIESSIEDGYVTVKETVYFDPENYNEWPTVLDIHYNADTMEYGWDAEEKYPGPWSEYNGQLYSAADNGKGWGNLLETLADEGFLRTDFSDAVALDSDYTGKYKESEENKIERFAVVRKSSVGSSLGEISNVEDQIVYEFDTKEEAEAKVEELNKTVDADEKALFGTEYAVAKK